MHVGHRVSVNARRATADTELLGDPTCRRFLMCLWHRAGATLTVTPTVADELVGNVRQSERRHWERTLRYDAEHGNRTYDDATYHAIIDAARSAAGAWIEAELTGRGAGGLLGAQANMRTSAAAQELAARIPLECFRRPERQSQYADRLIIAEAVVLGYTLLASENLGTIKHERTNAWLMSEGQTETEFILTIADAAKALDTKRTCEDIALDAVLDAALPDAERGIERDLRAVTAFIGRLARGHAHHCASWALDALETLEDPGTRFATARGNLPYEVRATEARRVTETRAAAQGAGYIELAR